MVRAGADPFHQGWFSDTLARKPLIGPVRVVYIDCDVAKGTSEVLTGVVAQLVPDARVFSQDFRIEPVRALLQDPRTWERFGWHPRESRHWEAIWPRFDLLSRPAGHNGVRILGTHDAETIGLRGGHLAALRRSFGGDPPVGIHRDLPDQVLQSHRDGPDADGRIFVCEQTGALKLIKNGVAPVDPVPHGDRRFQRRARAARGGLRSQFPAEPVRLRLLHGALAGAQPVEPVHGQRRRRRAGQRDRSSSSSTTSRAPPTTTAGRCTSAPTESSTSPSATTPTTPTRRPDRTCLGKILRLNSDGTIPTDNPFYTTASGKRGTRSGRYGLRNPVHLRDPAGAPA